jgi:hypothetical protein
MTAHTPGPLYWVCQHCTAENWHTREWCTNCADPRPAKKPTAKPTSTYGEFCLYVSRQIV